MAALVLLLLAASAFSCQAADDFRHISHKDLLPTSDRFVDEGVTSYSQLLFDVSSDQVIVGARDNLYRLSLRLNMLEKAPWSSPPAKVDMCQNKGQTEGDCHNFIKVLTKPNHKDDKIFACGTNAFSPLCAWRSMQNISNVIEWVKGVAKCPYNPNANITALMTQSGNLFVGSPTDFSGVDPAIYRADTHPGGGGHALRSNQYNSKWLNEPQFVGSFETDSFVFFLFREAAVEYINCGKIIYSRIARVCKNDSGGQLMLKDNWTTFVKARLNCSIPGDYPFYFDEIQGMSYSADEGVVYATFTTPSNGIAGSAICAFNMSAINAAFSGPFKHQETPGSAWERHHSPHTAHFECQYTHTRSHSLLDSSRYQLMDSAVQPTTARPLHTAQLERYTHIALDSLPTKLHAFVRIIYVATSDGMVKKISILPRTMETCVVEIWKPEINVNTPIKTLQYLKETESLYIGTEASLMRVSAHQCRRHVSRGSCLNAMDPYCGWNDLQENCTAAPNGDPLVAYWQQSVTSCPVLTAPVDGGWSSWSPWFRCSQNGNADDSGDGCQCQTRQCDNPAPQNGGAGCKGISISVSNCTVHGEWTPWSAWSACSQTCGMAVKTRRRTCGNPAPANGGRVCVGMDVNEIYCTNNPPCPIYTPPPRDGGWNMWEAWEACSAPCGGGFRTRKRECNNPEPQDGGAECPGSDIEYEVCNKHSCQEYKKMGQWTPWMANQNASSGDSSYVERRFRFACRAPVDPSLIKITIGKDEQRVCHYDGKCTRTSEFMDDAWTDWSPWSSCTVECGGGQQHRSRQCEGRPEYCEGLSRMSRACNLEPCKSTWSCWTDWSACTGSCGSGKRQRSRNCLTNGNGANIQCQGHAIQHESCEIQGCEPTQGWEEWTVWSLCNDNEEQHRRRKCLTSNPGPDMCQGHDSETRICVFPSNDVNAMGVHSNGDSSSAVGVVLVSCVGAFVLGAICACAGFVLYKHKTRPRIPSSPHYITAKQNSYVSVPLKEITTKRQHSFSSAGSSHHGTLSKTNNVNGGHNTLSTPKLYPKSMCPDHFETATMKRNSHLNNGMNRVDAEQDKFY